jgi:hypothetical protein
LPPGNLLGIWDNEARFKTSYFNKFDGFIYLVTAVIKMKMATFLLPEEPMMLLTWLDTGCQLQKWKKLLLLIRCRMCCYRNSR